MTQTTSPQTTTPTAHPLSEDERRAMWDEHERNLDHFLQSAETLFDEHPDQWLLIHSGGQVETFDDLVAMFDRLNTFDKVTRGAALHQRRRTGLWIL